MKFERDEYIGRRKLIEWILKVKSACLLSYAVNRKDLFPFFVFVNPNSIIEAEELFIR